MNIGIVKPSQSYSPEAYAYCDYLGRRGHKVSIVEHSSELNKANMDLAIVYLGLSRESFPFPVVHEYQSISIPPFSLAKDFLKKIYNVKPNGRIFLNSIVKNSLGFNDSTKYILRDMGVDDSMYLSRARYNPAFDIVYCGSVNRLGVKEAILKLSKSFRVVVVGEVTDRLTKLELESSQVRLLGRLNRQEVVEVYRECKFGLNYTPDFFPYNVQTSTKTLEYIASGLGVISNKYEWIESFSTERKIKVNWIEDVLENNISDPIDQSSSVVDLSWDNVLNNCGFENFLEKIRLNSL